MIADQTTPPTTIPLPVEKVLDVECDGNADDPAIVGMRAQLSEVRSRLFYWKNLVASDPCYDTRLEYEYARQDFEHVVACIRGSWEIIDGGKVDEPAAPDQV